MKVRLQKERYLIVLVSMTKNWNCDTSLTAVKNDYQSQLIL